MAEQQPASRFREAQATDQPAVVELMRDYYGEDGYPFSGPVAQAVMSGLLADPNLGRMWVAEVDGAVVGYVVVTFGYSFEYGGRDAFIDELYLNERHRGTGLGREAMTLALAWCASNDVKAVHLEVEEHRAEAHRLYERLGFEERGRTLMTRRLG